ncbi:hypothetical protein MP228_002911 [Amoeboaphelidium protococcarum]|nr:hypothetical protein MP228_002911 [Amoeboaphelidium protococcarum]
MQTSYKNLALDYDSPVNEHTNTPQLFKVTCDDDFMNVEDVQANDNDNDNGGGDRVNDENRLYTQSNGDGTESDAATYNAPASESIMQQPAVVDVTALQMSGRQKRKASEYAKKHIKRLYVDPFMDRVLKMDFGDRDVLRTIAQNPNADVTKYDNDDFEYDEQRRKMEYEDHGKFRSPSTSTFNRVRQLSEKSTLSIQSLSARKVPAQNEARNSTGSIQKRRIKINSSERKRVVKSQRRQRIVGKGVQRSRAVRRAANAPRPNRDSRIASRQKSTASLKDIKQVVRRLKRIPQPEVNKKAGSAVQSQYVQKCDGNLREPKTKKVVPRRRQNVVVINERSLSDQSKLRAVDVATIGEKPCQILSGFLMRSSDEQLTKAIPGRPVDGFMAFFSIAIARIRSQKSFNVDKVLEKCRAYSVNLDDGDKDLLMQYFATLEEEFYLTDHRIAEIYFYILIKWECLFNSGDQLRLIIDHSLKSPSKNMSIVLLSVLVRLRYTDSGLLWQFLQQHMSSQIAGNKPLALNFLSIVLESLWYSDLGQVLVAPQHIPSCFLVNILEMIDLQQALVITMQIFQTKMVRNREHVMKELLQRVLKSQSQSCASQYLKLFRQFLQLEVADTVVVKQFGKKCVGKFIMPLLPKTPHQFDVYKDQSGDSFGVLYLVFPLLCLISDVVQGQFANDVLLILHKCVDFNNCVNPNVFSMLLSSLRSRLIPRLVEQSDLISNVWKRCLLCLSLYHQFQGADIIPHSISSKLSGISFIDCLQKYNGFLSDNHKMQWLQASRTLQSTISLIIDQWITQLADQSSVEFSIQLLPIVSVSFQYLQNLDSGLVYNLLALVKRILHIMNTCQSKITSQWELLSHPSIDEFDSLIELSDLETLDQNASVSQQNAQIDLIRQQVDALKHMRSLLQSLIQAKFGKFQQMELPSFIQAAESLSLLGHTLIMSGFLTIDDFFQQDGPDALWISASRLQSNELIKIYTVSVMPGLLDLLLSRARQLQTLGTFMSSMVDPLVFNSDQMFLNQLLIISRRLASMFGVQIVFRCGTPRLPTAAMIQLFDVLMSRILSAQLVQGELNQLRTVLYVMVQKVVQASKDSSSDYMQYASSIVQVIVQRVLLSPLSYQNVLISAISQYISHCENAQVRESLLLGSLSSLESQDLVRDSVAQSKALEIFQSAFGSLDLNSQSGIQQARQSNASICKILNQSQNKKLQFLFYDIFLPSLVDESARPILNGLAPGIFFVSEVINNMRLSCLKQSLKSIMNCLELWALGRTTILEKIQLAKLFTHMLQQTCTEHGHDKKLLQSIAALLFESLKQTLSHCFLLDSQTDDDQAMLQQKWSDVQSLVIGYDDEYRQDYHLYLEQLFRSGDKPMSVLTRLESMQISGVAYISHAMTLLVTLHSCDLAVDEVENLTQALIRSPAVTQSTDAQLQRLLIEHLLLPLNMMNEINYLYNKLS